MFFDRSDAGRQLAALLTEYKGPDVIVYAIPRGGVEVGRVVTQRLVVPLDVVIARKVGHPSHPEVAICAITEDGEYICHDYGLVGIAPEWITHALARERQEAVRRRLVYKRDVTIRIATDKIAIIVDDGIATGLTMRAAIQAIRKQRPKKIVVAVPVAPAAVITELSELADEVVVLIAAERFRGAVGAYYTHFPQVSDIEVMNYLAEAQVELLQTTLQKPAPISVIEENYKKRNKTSYMERIHKPGPRQQALTHSRAEIATAGRRTAARLEGVVRNKGIKPKRKEARRPVATKK